MLSASVAAGLRNTIVSIDLDPGAQTGGGAGRWRAGPAAERVYFFNTDGDEALGTFTRAERPFSFCFIDHSHSYKHVLSACRALPPVILPGGFCLFHDFNDRAECQ